MQIERLFETVLLLLQKQTVTAAELAERFEISVRTVYRDIDALSAAGVPVYGTRGKGGGISLMEQYTLSRSLVSGEEQRQILAALQSFGATGAPDVDKLCQKLGGLFRQQDQGWLEVDFAGWGGGEREKQLFASLRDAILDRRVVEFAYSGSSGESLRREVEPLRLVFKGQSWYLYAWCRARRAERFFKLTRIRDQRVLEERFGREAPPGPSGGADVFAPGRFVNLVVRLDASQAFRVYDEFASWEQTEDGGFVASQRVPEGGWLYGWLLSFGEGCEVLSPPELRAEVARRLKLACAKYREEKDHG